MVTKMNRKKIGFLCCAVILMMLLAGCGNNRQGDNDTSGTPAVHAPIQTEETAPPTEAKPKPAISAEVEKPGQAASQPPATVPGQPAENQQPDEPTHQETARPVAPAPMPSETAPAQTPVSSKNENVTDEREDTETQMIVQIGDSNFTATLETNAAVDALRELLESGPLVIQMSDYAGFEKVGSLGTSLPASNSQITTQAGDIVLYQGNQIVLFYGTNSWSYTRLGRIDDLTEWAEALGSGDVTVTFSLGA